MNIERLEVIARWLETGGEPNGVPMWFTMTVTDTFIADAHDAAIFAPIWDWDKISGHSCGTAGCIAGAATLLWGEEKRPQNWGWVSGGAWWNGAHVKLGLDIDTANLLFAPDTYDPSGRIGGTPDWPHELESITPDWAARTIRHLMKTGKVRWDLMKGRVDA